VRFVANLDITVAAIQTKSQVPGKRGFEYLYLFARQLTREVTQNETSQALSEKPVLDM
jgi:hypothetical protein